MLCGGTKVQYRGGCGTGKCYESARALGDLGSSDLYDSQHIAISSTLLSPPS